MKIDKRIITAIDFNGDTIINQEGTCPLEVLLEKSSAPCVVLSGKAGSGKSTQIQLLRFEMLKKKTPFFYINLNRDHTNKESFSQTIAQIKEFRKEPDGSQGKEAGNRSMLVIFDAHDEMSCEVESEFYKAFQGIFDPSSSNSLKVLLATRLTEEDMRRKVEDRFRFDFAELKRIEERKLEQLIDLNGIRENTNLIELLRTPLFLTLYRQTMQNAALNTGGFDEIGFFERFIEASIKGEEPSCKADLLAKLSRIGENCFKKLIQKETVAYIGEEQDGLLIPTNFRTLFYTERDVGGELKCFCTHALIEQYAIGVFFTNKLLESSSESLESLESLKSFDFSICESNDNGTSVNALLRDSLIYAGRILAVRQGGSDVAESIKKKIHELSKEKKLSDEVKKNLIYVMCGIDNLEIDLHRYFNDISTNYLLQTLGGSCYCKKLWLYDNINLKGFTPSRLKIESLVIGPKVSKIGRLAYLLSQTLKEIKVDTSNRKFYSEGNCVITKKGKRLVLGCKASSVPTKVPTKPKSVSLEAFDNCQQYGLGLDEEGEKKRIELPRSVELVYPQTSIECEGYNDFNYKIEFDQERCFLRIERNSFDGWKLFYATHSDSEIRKQRKRRSKTYTKKVNNRFDASELIDIIGRRHKILAILAKILCFLLGSARLPFLARLCLYIPLYLLMAIAYILSCFVVKTGYWHWLLLTLAIDAWATGGIGIGVIIVFFILRWLYQTSYFRWRNINREMRKRVLEMNGFSVIELVNDI